MKSQDSKQNISLTGTNNQQSTINSSNTGTLPSQGPNWSKIQALKQRKSELEKLLAEKTSVLQQIEKQEAKILGAANHKDINIENFAFTSGTDRNLGHNDDVCNGILRNKVDANFRLSKKLSSKDQGDVERLILEMKMLQEVCNTSYKMTNDPNITKSVRRVHQEELEQAQAKLAAINQTLELMRKRQMAHLKSGNHIQPQQFTQNTFPTTSHGSSVITLNLTKSPPVPSVDVHFKTNGIKLNDNENLCNISNNMLSSKKYGSSSNLTTYPISERRNSTRSMTRNMVKKIDDQMHLDGISLSNRNDYINENRYTIMHCNGTEHLNSYTPFDSPTGYGDYLYMAPRQKVVDFENQSSPNQYHQHHGVSSRTLYTDTNQKPSPQSTTPKPKMQLVEGPYPNDNKFYCSPQHAFDDSAIVKSLMTKHGMRQSYNFGGFHPNCFFDDNLVMLSDRTSKSMNMNINSTPPSHLNSLRKHQRNALDLVSLSPTVASSFEDQPTLGLGGYWKTLSNNERVWCVVDTNFDNSTVKHGRVKKPAMQPTKSSSLGNFESISAGDEMGDKVSISSMNSETNKKPREKQWVETSLDGPAVKVKQSLSENETKTMPLYSYVPKNNTVQNHLQMNTLPTHHRQNPISPHNSSHDIGQSLISHPHKHQTSRERPKLSSHSMSISNYRSPLQQVEPPENMLLSLSISSGDQFKNSPIHQAIEDRTLYLHSNQNELLQQSPVMYPSSKSQSEHQQFHQIELNVPNGHDFLPHPTFTNQQNSPSKLSLVLPPIVGLHTSNNNFDTLRSNRSPITPNLSKVPDIRVESPKNMTVIQQATFMPYKEETKPFEMSDFYKYSTKFRQKDQKQQLVSAGTVNASINMEQTCKSNA